MGYLDFKNKMTGKIKGKTKVRNGEYCEDCGTKLNKDKQGGRSIKFIEITFEYKDEELEKEEKLKLKSNPKKTVLVEELEKRNNISTEENSKIAIENIRKIRQNMK